MLTKTISEYGPPVVALLVPFLFLVWPWGSNPQGRMLLRLFLICAVGWILFAGIAWCHGRAWQSEYAQRGSVPDWDPAFRMAVYVVGGGALTFLGSLPSMLIRGIVDVVLTRRRNQVQEDALPDA